MPGRAAEVQNLNFLNAFLPIHFPLLSSSKYLLDNSFSNTSFYSRPMFFLHLSRPTQILLFLLQPPPLQQIRSLFFQSKSALERLRGQHLLSVFTQGRVLLLRATSFLVLGTALPVTVLCCQSCCRLDTALRCSLGAFPLTRLRSWQCSFSNVRR
jgi:hypothetical protein